MRIAAVFVILVAGVAACTDSNEVSPFPTSPSPPLVQRPGMSALPIPAGIYTLSGVITETSPQAGRPLSGISVNAWVQTTTVGYSYMFAYGPRLTDAQGGYELAGIPAGARVRLQLSGQGYVQQCAAPEVHVNYSSRLDAALVPRASVSSSRGSVPPSSPGFRQISGVVYDVTVQGRRAVPDAFVDYEPIADSPAAVTFTDAQGRFLLCGIPEAGNSVIGASIGAGRFGYVTVPPGTDASIDIDIR